MLKRMVMIMAISIAAAHASAAELENLGQPCRAFNVLAGRVVADPSGREWLVLSNMNELTGAELIFVDPKTNEGKIFRAPKGRERGALNLVSGNRLVVGTFYDGQFMVFDMNEMKFIKTIAFPNEQYIWTFALGSDGRLYGGTYPGGKLGALDLNSYAVEDLGAPSPPNLYLRNTSATPDGRILCSFVSDKPGQLLFDPKTKKFSPLPKSIESIQIGVSWNGYFLSSSRAFKGENFDPVDPLPFPAPPEKGDWTVDAYVTTQKTLYLHQGSAIYRFKAGEAQLTKICTKMVGRFLGETSAGDVLGVRGQDYVVLRPGETEFKLIPIPVQGGPRVTHFLRADEKGRVWGGPTFGQTIFSLDVATKKFVNTSQVCEAGGEVYDAAFLNGKVYLVSYAAGDVIEYDPEQPWDQQGNKNPHTIVHLTARGYIRPIAGVMVGSDQKIYAGWMASYGKYGGAVSITDPVTGKTDLIENPFGEQGISGLALDEQSIYVGTCLEANGLSLKKGESPSFAVLDGKTHEVKFRKAFDGASGIYKVFHDAMTKLTTFSAGKTLQAFDPSTQQFTDLKVTATSHQIAGIGDGKIYFGQENSLVEFDLQSKQPKTIATAPAKIENVAISPKGDLFISCGADVFAVRK